MRLLLLPGLLNDARLWQAQLDALAGEVDASVADLTRADSIAALAAGAIGDMPAGPFALAGMSMGGYVALEVMRQAGHRILGLALLDTSARADTQESTENRRRLIAQSENDFDGVVTTLIGKQLHPDRHSDSGLVDTVRAMAHDTGREVFVRQQNAIIGRIDSRPSLAQIRCPTLILCGRDDVITPVEVHEEMQAQIAASRMVIVERCGHLSPLEQPDKVTDALKSWLQQLA
jgi:pimeloyl-ACP methyl ester carboxylesterase